MKPQTDVAVLPTWKKRIKANAPIVLRALKAYALILVLLLILIIAFFWNRTFVNIYPGQGGVLWLRFEGGTDLSHTYAEGLHLICPWDKMYIYDLRIHQDSHVFDALSVNGLPIRFEVSIRHRPNAEQLPQLHQQIGPDYLEKVVKPEVQSQVREVVSSYLPEEIYTSEGLLLHIIRQGAMVGLYQRRIILDDLLIKRMELPKSIQTAIENKLAAEQLSLQYDFLLKKETKEADRKRIEAAGIRDFQLIATQGDLFDRYLNYQGIQATLALAESNNSKVILFGNQDSKGLPLLFSLPPDDRAANAASPEVQEGTLPSPVDAASLMEASTRELLKLNEIPIESSTSQSTKNIDQLLQ
jgi:regulator of protease activity HflC (stomatin/prohibitin superfamily)